jgi:hypothetical protein
VAVLIILLMRYVSRPEGVNRYEGIVLHVYLPMKRLRPFASGATRDSRGIRRKKPRDIRSVIPRMH